jgi:hypothetical protein
MKDLSRQYNIPLKPELSECSDSEHESDIDRNIPGLVGKVKRSQVRWEANAESSVSRVERGAEVEETNQEKNAGGVGSLVKE